MAVTITDALLRDWPLPEPGETKHSRGSVLVIGGSSETPGGVSLAGIAALRSGAGRLQLAVAGTAAAAIAAAVPEAKVVGLPEDGEGNIRSAITDHLDELLALADAVCLGPGLFEAADDRGFVEAVVQRLDPATPTVLDAFALSVIAAEGFPLSHAILKPNLDEATLLLGTPEPPEDAEAAAVAIARLYQATAPVQGYVASASGAAWFEPQAGPGLGTSGSGDVLAGCAAGLLARGCTPDQAAVWAVAMHARAGVRLGRRLSPTGYLARELADELPICFTTASTA